MRKAVEVVGPGIAFWRARKHGWDRWAYGLICLEVPDWFHWSLALFVLDFDFAKDMHFDEYATVRLNVGPVWLKALYVEDRKN